MNIIVNQFLLFNNFDEKICRIIIDENIMIYEKIAEIHEYKEKNNYSTNNIIWKYNENNLRIPYVNNIPIKYYKLKSTDDIYDFISSSILLTDNQIISGEKIQNLADIVLGTQNSINWNPNNIFFSKSMTTINNIDNLDKYKSIFVFTHDLEEFYLKFGDQIKDKIIISHNSDHEIKYIKDVKLHLAQNCLIKNNKLCGIPIGIENRQWFDHEIFHKIRKITIKKTKNIYFYFSLTTHISRNDCYNKLKDYLEWNTKRSKEDYFKELAYHKYAICPRGNGLDTHRIWECLYLDTIPIVIKNDFVNINNLPIIILDDWLDLINFDFASVQFDNQELKKITVSYYDKIITNN
jgi:hypothetical protein